MSKLTAYAKFIQQALKYGFSLFGLPRTGQQTSYVTGDDGYYKKGYPRQGSDLVDNGDGTITDNATGLMWLKDPINNPGSPFSNLQVWTNALSICEALNFAGHTDWRLPNVNELITLIDRGFNSPAINTAYFPNTVNGYYWTSTTHNRLITNAWRAHFLDGELRYATKAGSNYVRPVRLGYPKD